MSLSSGGAAEFEAEIREEDQGPRINWTLSYNDGFSSTVTQAHIHFGPRHTNGGISIFLCTNLGNGPEVRSRARPDQSPSAVKRPPATSSDHPGS